MQPLDASGIPSYLYVDYCACGELFSSIDHIATMHCVSLPMLTGYVARVLSSVCRIVRYAAFLTVCKIRLNIRRLYALSAVQSLWKRSLSQELIHLLVGRSHDSFIFDRYHGRTFTATFA